MSSVKDVPISEEEFRHNNHYKNSSEGGGKFYAKMYYNDDGSLNEELTYSKSYYKELHSEDSGKNKEEKVTKEKKKKEKKEKKGKTKDGNKKEGCLKKILLAPFRLIWWLLKMILKLIGLSFILSLMGQDESNNSDN